MDNQHKPMRLMPFFLLSAAAVLETVSPSAARAQTCPRPARENASDDSGSGGQDKEMSESGALLIKGSRLADAGKTEQAIAYYKHLAAQPADKGNTPMKARLRLASLYLRNDRYDDAKLQASIALKSNASEKITTKARRILSDVEYFRVVDGADAELKAADATIDSADAIRKEELATLDDDLGAERALPKSAALYEQGQSAMEALLGKGCPLSDDYYNRIRNRIATVRLRLADVAGARTWLAKVDRSDIRPETLTRTQQLSERTDQLERDMKAGAELAQTRTLAETDAAAAIASLDTVAANNPGASPELKGRMTLYKADLLSRTGAFPAAWSAIDSVRQSPQAPDLQMAITNASDRVLRREADAELDAADGKIQLGKLDEGYRRYDSVIANQRYPEAARQRAALRKANSLRRENDFVGARQALTAIAANPADASIATRLGEVDAAIGGDAPARSFSGSWRVGLGYDTNAPAVTSALRDEDEIDPPYPEGEKFPDEFGFASLSGEYRVRANARNDYWYAAGSLAGTRQADLDRIHRLSVSAEGGRVFQLPKRREVLKLAARYSYIERGDKELYQDLDLIAQLDRRVGGNAVVRVGYDLTVRFDDRQLYDGLYHRLEAQIATRSSYGPALSVAVGRNDYDRKARQNAYLEVGADYRWLLGNIGQVPISASAEGNYRWTNYDQDVAASGGGLKSHHSNRIRGGVGLRAAIAPRMNVDLDYEYINIDSNTRSTDRRDHRFAISLVRRF